MSVTLRVHACLRICLVFTATTTAAWGQPQSSFGQPIASSPRQQPPGANQHRMMGTQQGTVDRCYYSVANLPPQPQVAKGFCQPSTVAVDCANSCGEFPQSWRDLRPYAFQPLAHGEYLGPIRLPASLDYRVRLGDEIRFIYILSREVLSESLPLRVGDELQISSQSDSELTVGDLTLGRGVAITQDGMLHLPLIGPVRAAGLTISQLRRNLNNEYASLIRNPAIDVIPIKTNTLLEDIRAAVDRRQGIGGQGFLERVHADGTIRLPAIGPVCVLGLTLDEIKREVNLRYRQIVAGLEVEPVLGTEAQHFVFVYGEVGAPGRYELLGPTSVTGALAMAQGTGGANVTGNRRNIVIFRRAEDWRLIATRVDLLGAYLGRVPTPADEIWLRDGDVIIVPPTPIKRFDDFVQQVFVDGIYGMFPLAQLGAGFTAATDFNALSP